MTPFVWAVTPTEEPVSLRRRRVALICASMAMLLISFNTTATNIAFPAIEDAFSAHSLSTVSWVVTGYNVAQTTMMLLGGRLADRLGRRRVFLWGMTVMAVGSLASGLAQGIWVLVAARVVQALGAAFVLPTSLAAVLPDYPKEQHARVVGLWAGIGVFGSTVGPSMAAGLLQLGSWRGVFLAVGPIAALTAIVARQTMGESRPASVPQHLDVAGAVVGTLTLALAALAIVQGPRWGWASPLVLGAGALAVLGGPTFVARCRRHPEPLLDLGLFAIPTYRVATAASGLLAVSTAATWLLYPLFMDGIWGYETWRIGLAITPGPAFLVLINPLAGRVADRHGYRTLMIVGTVLVTAGTLYLSLMLRPTNGYLVGFFPATMMIGGGMAMVLGPLNSAALQEVPDHALGAANAGFNTARFLGTALGVALAVAMLGDLHGPGAAASFQRALFVLAAVTALAPLLLALRYPRDPTRVRTGRVEDPGDEMSLGKQRRWA